jgi:hypothetical protein
MSTCECGQPLALDDMQCPKCGKKFTIEPRFTGFEIPEPPIDQWREELSIKCEYSEESLAEVKREAEKRKKGKRSPAKSKEKNISSFSDLTRKKNRKDYSPSFSRSAQTNWSALAIEHTDDEKPHVDKTTLKFKAMNVMAVITFFFVSICCFADKNNVNVKIKIIN